MQPIDRITALTGYNKGDFAVCLGCKICASVCTVNDLELSTSPQELLLSLFMGNDIGKEHPLVRYCTGCYRCAHACPWGIRIPEVVRALRETLGLESPFEKAFKDSLKKWGRVYEPYVILRTIPFLFREGYVKYLPRWTDYIGFHLPHNVKGK